MEHNFPIHFFFFFFLVALVWLCQRESTANVRWTQQKYVCMFVRLFYYSRSPYNNNNSYSISVKTSPVSKYLFVVVKLKKRIKGLLRIHGSMELICWNPGLSQWEYELVRYRMKLGRFYLNYNCKLSTRRTDEGRRKTIAMSRIAFLCNSDL